jgi:hypothetical protein
MANTITQIKRLIGLRFDDDAVKAELETHANFNAVAMPDGDVGFEVRPATRSLLRAAGSAPTHGALTASSPSSFPFPRLPFPRSCPAPARRSRTAARTSRCRRRRCWRRC